ncbi:hypothetical protein MUP77_01235 [Candidatus Bathyarchaeota archaeon]|nr:hypothetical protein [Candidatus Bathyarchaeota archaeon]
MIPRNITKKDILMAIGEIKRSGVPVGRSGKKFRLEYNGQCFPPKYIISLANEYANGKRLDSSEFGGGNESNRFLRSLGFNVVLTTSSDTASVRLSQKVKTSHSKTHHDERCPKCKDFVKTMLERIYGKVEQNYKFQVGTLSQDFEGAPHYGELLEIFRILREHRGFNDFVKTKTLPNCDFFMPDSGCILEFDESQHFTLPRKVALEHYPEELVLGFDRKRWIDLCVRIDSRDSAPPYRDEQRAWYDTVRDFLPEIKGLNPTTRIFAKDFEWCSLDPSNPLDVEKFKSLLYI